MGVYTNYITGKQLNGVRTSGLSSTELNAMYQATNKGSLGGNQYATPTTSTTKKVTISKPSSGSTGSNSVSTPSYSGVDYASQLANLYAQQQAQAQEYAAQQRAAAESAYRAGMERLGQAWDTKTGALKDNEKATIVGTTTYGKGVIQTIHQLTDGSGLKITTNEYYTPNYNKINKIGIEPNIEVELPKEYENALVIPKDKDTQLQKAIELLK